MKKSISYFRTLLCVSTVMLLTGCATGYHAKGLTGGYSEIITSSDSYIVTFKGNGYTSSEKVMRYSLRRASELTIQNGYNYFEVIASADQTENSWHSSSQGQAHGMINSYGYSNSAHTYYNGTKSSSTYAQIISKPGLSMKIKCYKKKPFFTDVIDAKYYLEHNPS